MNIVFNRFWLTILILVGSLAGVNGQTVALSYGDPAGNPEDAFDGNVFQAGNQYGYASIYATLGEGAKSFQIVSPGENLTKTVTSTGYFNIQPIGSMVVDKSKIINFSGTVTGSVAITVKPLSIATLSANVATEATPGSELTVSYRTGAGTFPVDLAIGKFKVQLLDASGNLLNDLLNSTDQYTAGEKFSSSRGDIRFIKATIPGTTPSGTYRVRVITQGLTVPVAGSPSSPFVIRTNTPVISVGSLSTGSYCAGSIVSFPFSTTGTFSASDAFQVQLIDAAGSILQSLVGTSTFSPIRALLPNTLSGGSYRFRIVSTVTNVVSNTGTVSVTALPTMTLSGSSATTAGSTAPVRVALTGIPPWSFSYTDFNPAYAPTYTVPVTTSSNSFSFNPTFFTSTTYDKTFVKGFRDSGCGASDFISGSAQITLSQITITTGTLSGTYCPGTSISVPFAASNPLPNTVMYQAQLSDSNGNFQNTQLIGSGSTSPITAILPSTLIPGTGYRVQIIVQKPATPGSIDYSSSASPVASSIQVSRPDAPTVTDVSFCAGAVLNPLTATGTNLKWYIVNSAQALPGAPVPPNNQSSVFAVSQTINNCESTLATINVFQKPLPSAPAVSSIALCQGAQGQFSSSIPNALWYSAATGGVGSPQPPALNNQAVGDQIVYVTQTVNGCESPRTAVKATVNPIPVAPTPQTPAPVCQFTTASPLTATGQNLTWYDQSGPLAGAPAPTPDVAGTISYSVTQKVNGCESPRASVTLLVRQAPDLPMASSVRYCVDELPRSLTATGSNLKWYTSPTGGTSTPTSPAFFTDVSKVIPFYVTQTDANNCESKRLMVSVTVSPPPPAPTVIANQAVCQFANVNALTASPNTGLIWQGSGITGSVSTAPIPSTTRAGTYTYVVTQKSGSCTSPASLITFTVRPQPVAPNVANTIAFCTGQTSAPLSATATGRLTWYRSADHSDTGLAQVIPNTERASQTVYYVTQTDNFNCESTNDTVIVRVSAKSTARLTGDGSIYRGDSTAIRVRLTGDGPWLFTDWNGKQVSTNDSLYVKWVTPSATQTYTIKNLTSSCGAGDIQNSYTLTVFVPLGTQSLVEPIVVNAYPNPVTGDLFVDWYSPTKQTVTLQLINADGKVIEQITRQAGSGSRTERFNVNSQPSGIYFLNVTTNKNGKLTRRILKQ